MTTPANQAPTGGLTPHLTIRDKRAKEAIDFYGKAFGATEVVRQPADDGERLMHAHVHINGASLMMHDDFPEYTGSPAPEPRSEEHTSELQSLMRISYAVFCLKKQKTTNTQ